MYKLMSELDTTPTYNWGALAAGQLDGIRYIREHYMKSEKSEQQTAISDVTVADGPYDDIEARFERVDPKHMDPKRRK